MSNYVSLEVNFNGFEKMNIQVPNKEIKEGKDLLNNEPKDEHKRIYDECFQNIILALNKFKNNENLSSEEVAFFVQDIALMYCFGNKSITLLK
jgi:hypothetical protein